ncbi:MAG: cation:proton antiporter [Georgfuchsia sp.]
MTYQAILIASIFLLLAFAIERFGRASGVPSVIVLIAVGLAGKPALAAFGLTLDGIDVAVPIIGAIGLVLIVLDGALDIELRRERLLTAVGAILMAGGGFALCTVVFTLAASWMLSMTLLQAAILAVPFAVISSAVAIPSSSFLPLHGREFVVYESSISDILGVMVFFSLVNSTGTATDVFLGFVGGGVLSLLLSAVCAVGLVLILMRIDGHVRFIPLLAGLFGLYAAGKLMHLSPLIMVLLFGLALNNPTLITRFRPFQRWLDNSYEVTLNEFKFLTLELTFAVRGFFFILLGYWTDLPDLASIEAWLATAFVLAFVYGSRHVMFRLSRSDLAGPLTWLAPRGLITVLLFLKAKETLALPHYLNGTVMLVVLVSATLIAVARWRHAKNIDVSNAPASDKPSVF